MMFIFICIKNSKFQEKRSPYCGGFGDLICGRCECAHGRGGDNCDCDLRSFGVNTADELESKCRASVL